VWLPSPPPPTAYPFDVHVPTPPPVRGNCGYFQLPVQFSLSSPTTKSSVFIQEMSWTFSITDGKGRKITFLDDDMVTSPTHYWEAFEIGPARTVVESADVWSWRELRGTRGSVKIEGALRLYHGKGVPLSMGHEENGLFKAGPDTHPWSGTVPSSTTKPSILGWWVGSDTPSSEVVNRTVEIWWDCTCRISPTSVITNSVSSPGGAGST